MERSDHRVGAVPLGLRRESVDQGPGDQSPDDQRQGQQPGLFGKISGSSLDAAAGRQEGADPLDQQPLGQPEEEVEQDRPETGDRADHDAQQDPAPALAEVRSEERIRNTFMEGLFYPTCAALARSVQGWIVIKCRCRAG
jgi:hypothetical protein